MDNSLPLTSSQESGVTPPAPLPATPPQSNPQSSPAPMNTPVTTSSSSGGGGRRKIIMVGIAVVLMLAGIVSGTLLLRRQQFEPSFAYDCTLYVFGVDESGAVTAQNGSLRNIPAQLADVYIDGQLVASFDVPALDSGEGASLGLVPVPQTGGFDWRVKGNKDCEQTGSFEPDVVAQCLNIKIFSEDWVVLTAEELALLSVGDVIRLTVGGTTTNGSFEAARFTVNGVLREAVTELRPGTEEFFDEYTIPVGATKFAVGAELMHSQASWF